MQKYPPTFNFQDWLINKRDCVFGYQVYKRMFTPYEQDNKFIDESEFTDIHFQPARIVEGIDLSNGDFLIGFHNISDDDEDNNDVEYYRLSEIRLFAYDFMQKKEHDNDKDEDG